MGKESLLLIEYRKLTRGSRYIVMSHKTIVCLVHVSSNVINFCSQVHPLKAPHTFCLSTRTEKSEMEW